jgi:hypothetical protein
MPTPYTFGLNDHLFMNEFHLNESESENNLCGKARTFDRSMTIKLFIDQWHINMTDFICMECHKLAARKVIAFNIVE